MARIRRPRKISDELIEDICWRINIGWTLRDIENENIASQASIHRWLSKGGELYDDFRKRYARARTGSAEAKYESINTIMRRMLLPKSDQKHIDANTGRVIIDTLKWQAAKLDPGKYGERKEVEHKGSVEVRPVREDAPDWLQGAIEASPNVVTIDGKAQEVEEEDAGDSVA